MSSLSSTLLLFDRILVSMFCHFFANPLSISPLPSYIQANLDETYAASTLVFPNGNDDGADGNVFYQVCWSVRASIFSTSLLRVNSQHLCTIQFSGHCLPSHWRQRNPIRSWHSSSLVSGCRIPIGSICSQL